MKDMKDMNDMNDMSNMMDMTDMKDMMDIKDIKDIKEIKDIKDTKDNKDIKAMKDIIKYIIKYSIKNIIKYIISVAPAPPYSEVLGILLRVWQPQTVRLGANTTHRILILAGIFGQSIVVDASYEMFMIATACKDAICVVERGYMDHNTVPFLGFLPAPLLLLQQSTHWCHLRWWQG